MDSKAIIFSLIQIDVFFFSGVPQPELAVFSGIGGFVSRRRSSGR